MPVTHTLLLANLFQLPGRNRALALPIVGPPSKHAKLLKQAHGPDEVRNNTGLTGVSRDINQGLNILKSWNANRAFHESRWLRS